MENNTPIKLNINVAIYVISGLLILYCLLLGSMFVTTGAILGTLMAMSIMFIVIKLPNFFKKIVKKYILISDIVLSSIATYLAGGLFGGGLILGIGAMFCAVTLSIGLKLI
jgi:hypothetical protein